MITAVCSRDGVLFESNRAEFSRSLSTIHLQRLHRYYPLSISLSYLPLSVFPLSYDFRLHLFISICLTYSCFHWLTQIARYAFQNDKDVCMSNSHINGQAIHFFPIKKARQRVDFTIFITGLMIAIDILCVGAVFYLKFYLVRIIHYYNGDVIAEVVNAAQILLLAELYTHIGKSDSHPSIQSSQSIWSLPYILFLINCTSHTTIVSNCLHFELYWRIFQLLIQSLTSLLSLL